jgi:hypothetical protein
MVRMAFMEVSYFHASPAFSQASGKVTNQSTKIDFIFKIILGAALNFEISHFVNICDYIYVHLSL